MWVPRSRGSVAPGSPTRATIALARALGPTVRVNAGLPGAFLTDLSEHRDMAAFERRARQRLAIPRGGEPDGIVGAALYFASGASSYTTGVLLRVDGGAPRRVGSQLSASDEHGREATLDLAGRVAVVTGGAGGLGRAVCRRFVAEGARVAAVDLVEAGVDEIAAEIGAIGIVADVGSEADIRHVVEVTERELGPIDLFFSNAGTGGVRDVFAPDEDWRRLWQVHVMAHVYAARAVTARMAARGGGYLLSTASGAALTAEPGSTPYSVTKHAALALAECLAIVLAPEGIKVSCFCPLGIATPMLLGRGADDRSAQVGLEHLMSPEAATDVLVAGIRDERFLILSHPEVKTYFERKASDYDRWLAGMRRLYDRNRS